MVEDAVFGFRAAGPALLSNISYFEKRIVEWDPAAMKSEGLRSERMYSPNDNIQIALIGAGGMGQGDAQWPLPFPA